jgi:hypothetical protein
VPATGNKKPSPPKGDEGLMTSRGATPVRPALAFLAGLTLCRDGKSLPATLAATGLRSPRLVTVAFRLSLLRPIRAFQPAAPRSIRCVRRCGLRSKRPLSVTSRFTRTRPVHGLYVAYSVVRGHYTTAPKGCQTPFAGRVLNSDVASVWRESYPSVGTPPAFPPVCRH